MFLRELGVMGVIGVILFFFVSWGIISFIQRRRRIWRKLRSAVYPEFQPSEFYVQSRDSHRCRAAAVCRRHSLVCYLFTAADVIDVRRSSKQGNPQCFQFPADILEIDLCSATLPYVRFSAGSSSEPLQLVASLLKFFQKDATEQKAEVERRTPPRPEVLSQVVSAPGLEQELAALRREVANLTAVLASMREGTKARTQATQHKRKPAEVQIICSCSGSQGVFISNWNLPPCIWGSQKHLCASAITLHPPAYHEVREKAFLVFFSAPFGEKNRGFPDKSCRCIKCSFNIDNSHNPMKSKQLALITVLFLFLHIVAPILCAVEGYGWDLFRVE